MEDDAPPPTTMTTTIRRERERDRGRNRAARRSRATTFELTATSDGRRLRPVLRAIVPSREGWVVKGNTAVDPPRPPSPHRAVSAIDGIATIRRTEISNHRSGFASSLEFGAFPRFSRFQPLVQLDTYRGDSRL